MDRFLCFRIFLGLLILVMSFAPSLLLAGEDQEEDKGPCPKPYIVDLYPKAAAAEEDVKIRGHRFGMEEGKVIFPPGIKGEVVEWTNSRIWVTVPKGARTGMVVVSVPCGKVSNENYFIVREDQK